MNVYVPNPKNPLLGTWCDLPHRQRVNPSAVRAIWRERFTTKHLSGGIPLAQAREDAAAETATMLGLTLRTVRVFCKLERGKKRAPNATVGLNSREQQLENAI